MRRSFDAEVIHKRVSRLGGTPHILERVQWLCKHIHKRASGKRVRSFFRTGAVAMHYIHTVRRIGNEVTNVLFPVHCVGCKTSNIPLCSTCASRITQPESSPGLITAWSFKDPRVRTLIHHLKYRGRTVVVRVCAEALSERLTEEISEKITYGTFQDPLIIPIPLYPSRKRSRGYNQAALLAQTLAETALFSCAYEQNVLKRIKDTPAQAHIKDKQERARNIVGAFALHPDAQEKIAGRDIILIDDVATTGATLREAEKVLKHAGAREVLLAAVAH